MQLLLGYCIKDLSTSSGQILNAMDKSLMRIKDLSTSNGQILNAIDKSLMHALRICPRLADKSLMNALRICQLHVDKGYNTNTYK